MNRAALAKLPNARPSQAHQWANGCTGAPRLRAQFEAEQTEAAAEGNRLHDVASNVLKGFVAWGEVAPDDKPILKHYIEDVRREVAAAPVDSRLLVEQHLKWSQDLRLQGTPDCVLVNYQRKHVIIWDLKTGFGLVEVVRNWQLLCYALMLFDAGWTYELRIAQSKVYHPDGFVRAWSPTNRTLKPLFAHIEKTFDEAMSPIRGKVRTGEHCRYCEALHACNAARAMTLSAVDWADKPPADLSPEHMARELATLRETESIVKRRADALETTIKTLLKKGVAVPLVRFVPGKRGALKWLDEKAARLRILADTGDDPAVAKMRTPKQLIDAGVDEKLVNELAQRAPTSTKLEVDLDGSKVNEIFDGDVDLSHAKQGNKSA